MVFHSPSECLNSVYAFLQPIPFCMARSRSGGSCKHRLCSGVAATRFGWCGAFKRLLTLVCTSLEVQQGLSLLFSSVPKGTSALVVMEMQPATVVSCCWQLAALSVWGKQVMKNWHVRKGGDWQLPHTFYLYIAHKMSDKTWDSRHRREPGRRQGSGAGES